MAKHYKKLPSEILRIQNEYDAYCFDEVAFFYEIEAMEEDGSLNWDKLHFIDNKKKTNEDFVNFIKAQGGGADD